jgi:hypothetical protein
MHHVDLQSAVIRVLWIQLSGAVAEAQEAQQARALANFAANMSKVFPEMT